MSASPKPRCFVTFDGKQTAEVYSADHIVITHSDFYGECVYERQKDGSVSYSVRHDGRKIFVKSQTEMPNLDSWTYFDSPVF